MSDTDIAERLDNIPTQRMLVAAIPAPDDLDPHRPELAVWAAGGDETGAPCVTLLICPLFAQHRRYVHLSPHEARTLAALLTDTATKIDAIAAAECAA